MPEPTEEERRNGWDEKSLSCYLDERAKGQANLVNNPVVDRKTGRTYRGWRKPQAANSKYSPHRWRG